MKKILQNALKKEKHKEIPQNQKDSMNLMLDSDLNTQFNSYMVQNQEEKKIRLQENNSVSTCVSDFYTPSITTCNV